MAVPRGDRPAALFVRAVNWLGDAVMTTPALAAVRAAHPGASLTLVAKPLVAEMFRHHPHVDRILVYDKNGRHRGLAGMVRMAREARAAGCDAAILFQNAFDAALLALLSGIPERMGYATDGRRLLLTRAVPVTEEVLARHEVEYYLSLTDALGIPRPAGSALRLAVTGEERVAMRERLRRLGVPEGKPILGINPGATYGAAKRWYPERFAAAADALAEEWDASTVLMGSGAESPLAAAIAGGMRRKAVDLSGKTTVRELMALVDTCSFLVTNDSGPMHIAAALGVPLTAIFGPTDWRRTSPWTPRARVVRAEADCAPCKKRECDRDHACMLGVTAEMVVAASLDLYVATAAGRRPEGPEGADGTSGAGAPPG